MFAMPLQRRQIEALLRKISTNGVVSASGVDGAVTVALLPRVVTWSVTYGRLKRPECSILTSRPTLHEMLGPPAFDLPDE
jgi:hypothetical protein